MTTNAELVWPPELVQQFLGECLKFKEKLQRVEPPLCAWKDIASAMDEAGHNISWENCRAKFTSMFQFFTGTLLRTGGQLGGIKCPYWDLMCEIHDVPVDYVMPAEGGEGSSKQSRCSIMCSYA